MAEYQEKRKVRVTAHQFKSDSHMWPANVVELTPRGEDSDSPGPVYQVRRPDNTYPVHDGDWIVLRPTGETWVIDDARFRTDYELVNGERDADNI